MRQRASGDVDDERPANSAPHRFGIDEEVIPLEAVRENGRGDETDDAVIDDSHTDTAFADRPDRRNTHENINVDQLPTTNHLLFHPCM